MAPWDSCWRLRTLLLSSAAAGAEQHLCSAAPTGCEVELRSCCGLTGAKNLCRPISRPDEDFYYLTGHNKKRGNGEFGLPGSPRREQRQCDSSDAGSSTLFSSEDPAKENERHPRSPSDPGIEARTVSPS